MLLVKRAIQAKYAITFAAIRYPCLHSMKIPIRFLLVLLFVSAPLIGGLWAQLGPPPDPPCWPPPCIPIDGGLSLLLGAGALLGGKMLWGKQRSPKSNG